MGTAIATFVLVKVPLMIGYYKILTKVVNPVIQGTVEGIRDYRRDRKAELNKEKEENN